MKDLPYSQENILTLDDPDIYIFIEEHYDELKSRLGNDEFGEKIFAYLIDSAETNITYILDCIKEFVIDYLEYYSVDDREEKYVIYTRMIGDIDIISESMNYKVAECLEQRDIDNTVNDVCSFYNTIKTGIDTVICDIIDESLFKKETLLDSKKLQEFLNKIHEEVKQ